MPLYQKATVLHATNDAWDFAARYNGDIYAINRSGGTTRRKRTDLHVLAADTDYRTFKLQISTALGRSTPIESSFEIDFNGDLFGFFNTGGGRRRLEIHVLTAASNYQNFRLQVQTPFAPSDRFTIKLGPDNDVYVIDRKDQRKTAVHILRAADDYQRTSFDKLTVLHDTMAGWDFAVSPNRDIVGAKFAGSNNRTEYHILSAVNDYQQFSLQSATDLRTIDSSWKLLLPQPMSPGFISRKGTGSNKTEIHVPSTVVIANSFQIDIENVIRAMSDAEVKEAAIECGIQIAGWGINGAITGGTKGAAAGAITGALTSQDCRKLVTRAIEKAVEERGMDRQVFEKMDRSNHDLERFERDRNTA